MRGETSTVEFLLLQGAKIDATDHDGWQPLHYAAWDHQEDGSTVKFLLEHGANANAPTYPGETPLLAAAQGINGGTDANVLEFIAHGAKVNVQEPLTLETPLKIAITEHGFPAISGLLCAGADPNIPDKNGQLPIEQADAANPEEVAALLAFGARPAGQWTGPSDDPVVIAALPWLGSQPRNDKRYAIKTYCSSKAST